MSGNYERVKLDELRQGRRGKHHELIEGILSDFASLPDGQAIKIPLSQVKGVSLAHLRAAVSRAASSQPGSSHGFRRREFLCLEENQKVRATRTEDQTRQELRGSFSWPAPVESVPG